MDALSLSTALLQGGGRQRSGLGRRAARRSARSEAMIQRSVGKVEVLRADFTNTLRLRVSDCPGAGEEGTFPLLGWWGV